MEFRSDLVYLSQWLSALRRPKLKGKNIACQLNSHNANLTLNSQSKSYNAYMAEYGWEFEK